jgi:glycosyltransferase involved in cell wall biosynthesis
MSVDLLVVSLGTTGGWRAAASELTAALRRAGASVAVAASAPVSEVRTFALTDYVQARAARRACLQGIAEHAPTAIVYCSMTSALLWPEPGAVWLDSIAAENRPGRHGVWQRVIEQRRLRQAPLILAMSEGSLPLPNGAAAHTVVVPSAVEPSTSTTPIKPRDIAAITYAGDPVKKRLDTVLAAWANARRDGETLVVAGTETLPRGDADGVQLVGRLPPDDYRALLRRARAFVAAPEREDYGIAPLEALADGCMLVSTPAPGPYPALRLARELDERLVTDHLEQAIRTALDDPAPGYAARAAELVAPFSRAAVDQTITQHVLPALLPAWRSR